MSLITPAEAEAFILKHAVLLGTERISLENGLGRVLREDLFADQPFPPFDRVTMDGIAFRLADGGTKRQIQGLHAAGDPQPGTLAKGACWQIMTGALIPEDCDTVVPYEEVRIADEGAEILCEPEAGIFIHRQGSDAAEGALLVHAGTKLGPGHLGMAASIGAVELLVTRKPKIKILTTGDELIPMEGTPLPHQLRQSNGLTLLAAMEAWGPVEAERQHLADDFQTTREGISQAMKEADLVVLSGGISKGKKDYVRPALEELIGPPVFHGVAQRPGKPLAFWPEVVALPGNPNSTLTTFHRYLVPLLEKMTGGPGRICFPLQAKNPVKCHPKLTQYLPSKIHRNGTLEILSPQNSGDFLTPLSGIGFVEIPPGEGELWSLDFSPS